MPFIYVVIFSFFAGKRKSRHERRARTGLTIETLNHCQLLMEVGKEIKFPLTLTLSPMGERG